MTTTMSTITTAISRTTFSLRVEAAYNRLMEEDR